MALVRHEVPILEYDTAQRAVIMPGSRKSHTRREPFFFFLRRCGGLRRRKRLRNT